MLLDNYSLMLIHFQKRAVGFRGRSVIQRFDATLISVISSLS